MKIKRIYIRKAIKEILGKEIQLSLFPVSSIYKITCNKTKICYNENNCDHCAYADIIRKDYDKYTNPQKY